MAKKYIDADLLVRKIKGQIRLENLNFAALGGGGQTFCTNTLEWVLKQIDSLQQEQSCDTCTNDKGCVTCKDGELWEGKEQPSEDLKKAAEEYRQGEVDTGCDYIDDSDGDSLYHSACLADAFIAGAEWQKERNTIRTRYKTRLDCYEQGRQDMREEMMKEAVDGFIFQSADYYPKQLIAGYNGELGMGDKVKIVIVPDKEDKK